MPFTGNSEPGFRGVDVPYSPIERGNDFRAFSKSCHDCRQLSVAVTVDNTLLSGVGNPGVLLNLNLWPFYGAAYEGGSVLWSVL